MTAQGSIASGAGGPLADQIADLLSSSLLTEPLQPLTSAPGASQLTSPARIASLIDHTLLAPAATPAQVEQVCQEAIEYGARTVCVNSCMIPTAAAKLAGSKVVPISVVGFPFGAANTEGKVAETKVAVQQGAKEIDMVQNLGLLKSEQYEAVFSDIQAVVQAAAPHPVKVILETAMLSSPQELAISSLLACLAGAKFIKTSTGYGGGGAKPEDVRLMYEVAQRYGKQTQVEVKASGGIRSFEAVKTMVANGATRVGASGTKSIIADASGAAPAAASGPSGY